jgi:hypothetical protein
MICVSLAGPARARPHGLPPDPMAVTASTEEPMSPADPAGRSWVLPAVTLAAQPA